MILLTTFSMTHQVNKYCSQEEKLSMLFFERRGWEFCAGLKLLKQMNEPITGWVLEGRGFLYSFV